MHHVQLIESRKLRNTPEGYSILEAKECATQFTEHFKLGKPHELLFCTDGYYRAVMRALADLRAIEDSDPTCRKGLCFKPAAAASTITLDNGTYLTGEFYWEPISDGAKNAYYALYGTVGVPFLEKFEAVGKIGYEGYEDKISTPPYLWYEASLKYSLNDHVAVGVAYQGSDLSTADCALQAYTDCDQSVFATITLKGNLSDLSK